jgi:hypothetical protein
LIEAAQKILHYSPDAAEIFKETEGNTGLFPHFFTTITVVIRVATVGMVTLDKDLKIIKLVSTM